MKKMLSLILVVCFIFTSIPQKVNGATIYSEEAELQKQEEIERIF